MDLNINTETSSYIYPTVDSLISLRYPQYHIRGITNSYSTNSYISNNNQVFIHVEKNKEVPLFIMNPYNLYQYSYTERRKVEIPGGYIQTLSYYDIPMKVLGAKFYNCFQNLAGLKKYATTNTFYYIGKGVITNHLFEPLILTTYTFNDADLESDEYILITDNIKIYLNRLIFTSDFANNNKRLSREINKVILPELMKYGVKINIKKELNMFNTTYVDPSLNINQLQEKLLEEMKDAEREIIRELQ